MIFLRRLAILLPLLLIAILLPGLLLYGDRLAIALLDRYLASAELELRRKGLKIDVLAASFSANELALHNISDNQTLLTIEDLQGQLQWSDLLQADIDSASLAASKVAVFLEPGEESAEANTGWLGYRSWLPGRVDIDELIFYWPQQQDASPLALLGLKGRVGQQPGNYDVWVNAQYAGDYLSANGTMQELERPGGDLDQLQLVLNLGSQQRGFHIHFDGEVSESSDGLHYAGAARGDLKDVPWLLHELGADYPVEGALSVRSDIRGDLDGLQLSELHLVLDNTPEFHFSGNGEFDYAFDGTNRLDIVIDTELADLQRLGDLWELDLSQMGAARASLHLQGPFDELGLTDISLQTGSGTGIEIDVVGEIRISHFSAERLLAGNGVTVNVKAPGLDHLQSWTGDLGFETGPWQARATLSQVEDRLRLTDIQLTSDDGAGLTLRAQGDIADAGNINTGDFSTINGIELAVELASADSLRLTQLFAADLPELGSISARATLSQVEDRLRISDIRLASDDGAGLTLRAQGDIADAGNINTGDFSAINGIELEVELASADSRRLTQLFAPDLPELGSVSARAALGGNNSLLRIRDLDATVFSAGKYRLTANNGSLDLHPGSESPLRELQLRLGADLYSSAGSRAGQDAQHSQGKLSGELSIARLEPLEGVAMNLQFQALSTSRLLQMTRSEFAYPGETGFLNGKVRLQGSGAGFRLDNIDIRNTGNPQVKFAIAGAINNLEELSAIDLQAQGAVSDRALLRELSGLDLGPWRGELHITGSEQDIKLLSQHHFGDTELSARLRLGLDTTGLTALDGKISSPRLDLRDFGLSADSAPAAASQNKTGENKTGKSQAIARALKGLPRIPINLQFRLGQIVINRFTGEQLQADFVAADGLYTLRQLELTHAGGHTRLQGSLDSRREPAGWALKGSVLDLPAQELMIDLGISGDITGSINTAIDLAAQGYSPQAIISSLGGTTMLVLEDTTIKGAAYDVLATEKVAWFYSGAALEDKTVFSCIMADFTLDKGRARTEELFIATDRMLAVGTAGFDFNQMTVDVEITPRSRDRSIQIPGKVKVTGPVDDLHISSPVLTAASDATAEAVTLVPRIALGVMDKAVAIFGGNKEMEQELSRCKQVAVP